MRGHRHLVFRRCAHCPNGDWCARHGCTTWNDESRARYERLKAKAAESNREIDELERVFGAIETE